MERFALGRLLWRLSRGGSGDRFVLKGAQLFTLWAEDSHRPTRDVDLLGSGEASPESLKEFFEMLLDGPSELARSGHCAISQISSAGSEQ